MRDKSPDLSAEVDPTVGSFRTLVGPLVARRAVYRQAQTEENCRPFSFRLHTDTKKVMAE